MGADEPTNNIKKEDYLQKFIPDQFNFFKNNSKNRFWNKNNKNYINNKNKKTKNIKVYIKEFNHNFDNLFASIVFLIRKNNDCNYLCKQSKYQKKYEKMINKDLMNLIKNSLKKCMDILISSEQLINQSILSRIEIEQYINFSKRYKAICLNLKSIFDEFEAFLTLIKNNFDNKVENTIQKFNQSFEKLFVSLAYLVKKKEKLKDINLCQNKKYDFYKKKNSEELMYCINDSLKTCKMTLKIILDSQNYTINLLFSSREINQYISILTIFSQNDSDNSLMFKEILDLFLEIKRKNENMANFNNSKRYSIKSNMNIKLDNNNQKSINIKKADKITKNDKNINHKNQNDYITNQNNKQLNLQILLDKQAIIQAQDLALLNDNFGRALSSLECYANRLSGKKLSNSFDYYNMFNLNNTQKLDELKKKAFIQTQIFQLSYDDYIKNYKKYEPPNNIKIEALNELLINWMNHVNNKDKFIYQGMINIISSLDNSFFKEQFEFHSQKCKDARIDPKKISSFAPGISYYNQQRCQEAKNNYMEKGKIVSSLNINQNYSDDTKAEDLQRSIEINLKNYEEEREYQDLK